MIKDFNRFSELCYQRECIEEELVYLFNKLSSEEKKKLVDECRECLPVKILWKYLNEYGISVL